MGAESGSKVPHVCRFCGGSRGRTVKGRFCQACRDRGVVQIVCRDESHFPHRQTWITELVDGGCREWPRTASRIRQGQFGDVWSLRCPLCRKRFVLNERTLAAIGVLVADFPALVIDGELTFTVLEGCVARISRR